VPTSPPDTGRVRLTWKAKLLLVAFGLLLALVSMELGLRIVQALQNPAQNEGWTAAQAKSREYWAIYDADLGYRQNPRFGGMNSDGLRDHEVDPKAGRFRVLFLGDSVAVYGDTVDDTLVGHLRATLHRDPAFAKVDVVNGGVKGYTNYQEVLFLKKFGVRFEPNLVGFEFCLNDLFKFLQSFQLENGHLVPGTYQFSTEAVSQSRDSLWRRVAKQSHLLVWLINTVPIARNAAEWRAHQGFSFDYRVDVRNAWQDEPWRDIERQLQEAIALGREHGFPLFMVSFPLAVQYDPDYLARDREYVLKPQRKLREICERLRIPFYDIYADLGPRDFINDGLHLTADGRRIAGERIAAFLERSGLLSSTAAGANSAIGR
jgi:lysophospholipase L1-like esterase